MVCTDEWEVCMGLFDDLGKVLKKVEDEVKKSDPDRHVKDVGQELTKAGRDISREIDRSLAPAQAPSPASPGSASGMPAQVSTDKSRSPHKGYAKIVAWMKQNYKNRISGSSDNFQQGLGLEQLTAEACSGLPAKARKGFMEYLKKQNYKPLLK